MHEVVLGAIRWFPEVRGILITVVSVLILCGSVYLLLATNMGVRQGLLVAVAGLMGWMTIMGAVWWVYGIGPQGRAPSWKPLEVVVGELDQSSEEVATRFPDGWRKLSAGDAEAAEADAAAASVLTDEDDPNAPFTSSGDFVLRAVHTTGGEDIWLGFRHKPHYALVQVQEVVPQQAQPGQAPPIPEADPSKPVTNVVMVRDLGSLRLRPAVITVLSLAIFLVVASVLHRRDKELMAARIGEG